MVDFTDFATKLSEIVTRSRETSLTKDAPAILGTVTVSAILLTQVFTDANPIGRCIRFWKQLSDQEKRLTSSSNVKDAIENYSALHREKTVEERNASYASLVNHYYDLATVFYEWGWGNSFHFSFQFPHETFHESIRRHEYQLASQLTPCLYDEKNNGTSTKKKILDVGCGIGGPMRSISKFLHVRVVGVTLNQYQVQRGNELNERDINADCISTQGDFMDLPFNDNEFDGAYAIEATCHAPDRIKCYKQILRCIKPGGIFVVYEWCMTDKFDPTIPEHLRLKKDIEEGNGLPDIINCKQCLEAMEAAGFEVLLERDQALVSNVQPWQTPLLPSWNLLSQRFQFNWLGGRITNFAIAALESLLIAPKGTVKTQQVLQAGGFALRDAGEAGIFTTMYLMVGRKPLQT